MKKLWKEIFVHSNNENLLKGVSPNNNDSREKFSNSATTFLFDMKQSTIYLIEMSLFVKMSEKVVWKLVKRSSPQ